MTFSLNLTTKLMPRPSATTCSGSAGRSILTSSLFTSVTYLASLPWMKLEYFSSKLPPTVLCISWVPSPSLPKSLLASGLFLVLLLISDLLVAPPGMWEMPRPSLPNLDIFAMPSSPLPSVSVNLKALFWLSEVNL